MPGRAFAAVASRSFDCREYHSLDAMTAFTRAAGEAVQPCAGRAGRRGLHLGCYELRE